MTTRSIFIQVCGDPAESDACVVGLYETRVSEEYADGVAADIASNLVMDNILVDDPASLFTKAFTESGEQIRIDEGTAPTEEVRAFFIRRCVPDSMNVN